MPRDRNRFQARAGLLSALLFALAATSALADDEPPQAEDGPLWVFVGTYTGDGNGSQGIYRIELDPKTGSLSEPKLAAKTPSPSFLAIDLEGNFLYAVGEMAEFQGKKTGSVCAFKLDARTGELTPINRQSSGGSGPCHVFVDASGRAALAANYGSGSVASLPIGDDGALGEPASIIQHHGKGTDPKRQEGPHAHSINLDRDNRFAIAADLGLDKLLIYRFDPEAATLTPNDPPSVAIEPGSGPRHFAFHPDGRHAYVINELSSTVTAFSYDPAQGRLETIQTISSRPEGADGVNYPAEVQVHPSGRFLYGSNRGDDTIAIFSIGPDGKLKAVGHEPTGGKNPRNFGIDPTGRFLLAANQDTNSIVVFRIDPETGQLEPTGSKVEVAKPVCVKFLKKRP